MLLSCDHEAIFRSVLSSAEKCVVISEACADSQELVNFYRLYYCGLPHAWLFGPLLIVVLLAVFTCTCEIVEGYIAPAIVMIVKEMKMSDALAGVTLLAFANGIGDIITALVASGTEDAISYNVGALFGAGLFVMTVVVFLSISSSTIPIVLTKGIIYRDILIYILATLFTIYCAFKGEITTVDSLIFIFLYFVIIIVVLVDEYRSSPERQSMVQNTRQSRAVVEDDDEFQKLIPELDPQQLQLIEVIRRSSFRRILFSLVDAMQHRRQIRMENESEHERLSGKVLEVIDAPAKWLRKLTIPPCNEETYDRNYLFVWPFLGIPFILWAVLREPQFWWLFYLPVAVLVSALFYFFSPKDPSTPPRFFLLICIIGVVSGTLWTKIVCEILIDTLSFIGVMANLSTTYLGLTIIAIGNALPDSLTTIALAKNGQAILGLTGGYAGQIFGLLVGFGLSMLKKNLVTGESVQFDLFNMSMIHKNLLCLLVLLTALTVMLVTFGWSVVKKFKLTNAFGRIVFAIYVVFFLLATIYALIAAIQTF